MKLNSNEKKILARLILGMNRIRRGWTQHNSVIPNTTGYSYCATGACSTPKHRNWDITSGHAIAVLQTTLATLENTSNVVGWNDHPARNKKDVLTLFEKAIKNLKKNGFNLKKNGFKR